MFCECVEKIACIERRRQRERKNGNQLRRRIENCEFLTEKKKIFFWAEKKNKIFHHFIMRVEKAGKPLLLEEMIRKKKFVKLLKRLAMKNRNV